MTVKPLVFAAFAHLMRSNFGDVWSIREINERTFICIISLMDAERAAILIEVAKDCNAHWTIVAGAGGTLTLTWFN